MHSNIIHFSRNKLTTAMSSVDRKWGDLTGGGQKGDKQWLQGKHHLGLSTFWMLIPAGKTTSPNRKGDWTWDRWLCGLIQGRAPAPADSLTRATRAAAGLPLSSSSGPEAERVRTTPAGAENTSSDEICLWESSQQNFIMSYNTLIT